MAPQTETTSAGDVLERDDQPGELFRANLVNHALNTALPALAAQSSPSDADSEGGDL